METTQMSIRWWMDKQNVAYPYNGIFNPWYNMDELWEHFARWKKLDIKGHVLYYMILCILNFQNKQIHRDRK